MLHYLRDVWTTRRLEARYRRRCQEEALAFLERPAPHLAAPHATAEQGDRWYALGGTPPSAGERTDLRDRVRAVTETNPHARNMLRLLEVYVAGPGLRVSPHPVLASQACRETTALCERAAHLWHRFLAANARHFSYREHARRAWRDGETFLRLYPTPSWPPAVRFIDPETIASPPAHPQDDGILTDPDDTETVRAYQHLDPATGELLEEIDAAEILHTRVGVDSNEKRGRSVFAPILPTLERFERWLDTELQARKLQASLVLWRKVQGSPSQLAGLTGNLSPGGEGDGLRRERYAPGTILTTSHNTDLQFLSPNTNFGDAIPLGRLTLLCAAAGAGVPEFMLTADASNANFSSTMVAEGPAVKLFESEQQFFAAEFTRLWTWAMEQAVLQGLLPTDFFDRIKPEWSFPQLINRDRARERQADVQLVAAGILSRAEVARRDNVDPHLMQTERHTESPTPSEPEA